MTRETLSTKSTDIGDYEALQKLNIITMLVNAKAKGECMYLEKLTANLSWSKQKVVEYVRDLEKAGFVTSFDPKEGDNAIQYTLNDGFRLYFSIMKM